MPVESPQSPRLRLLPQTGETIFIHYHGLNVCSITTEKEIPSAIACEILDTCDPREGIRFLQVKYCNNSHWETLGFMYEDGIGGRIIWDGEMYCINPSALMFVVFDSIKSNLNPDLTEHYISRMLGMLRMSGR